MKENTLVNFGTDKMYVVVENSYNWGPYKWGFGKGKYTSKFWDRQNVRCSGEFV